MNDMVCDHRQIAILSMYSNVGALTWESIKNEPLTGKQVVNCLKNIMNAFDLVVKCGAVPVIKVNLPKAEVDFMGIHLWVKVQEEMWKEAAALQSGR